jgi:hypothetical protein
VQYAAPTYGAWPVDLMVVEDDTFDRIHEAATPKKFGGGECLVASPDHLLAMKFHALRYVDDATALNPLFSDRQEDAQTCPGFGSSWRVQRGYMPWTHTPRIPSRSLWQTGYRIAQPESRRAKSRR